MFYRSNRRPMGRSFTRFQARALFAAVYLLYPLGCVLQVVPAFGDTPAFLSVVGLSLVAIALLAFAVLAGSSLQRQAQEPDSKLDERELAQRNRAAYRAHSVFAGIVLLGLIYLQLQLDLSDKVQLWAPTSGEHWNALFWGLLLLALTLPAAFLAWEDEPPLDD